MSYTADSNIWLSGDLASNSDWVGGDDWYVHMRVNHRGLANDKLNFEFVAAVYNQYATINYGQTYVYYCSQETDGQNDYGWSVDDDRVYPVVLNRGWTNCKVKTDWFGRIYGTDRHCAYKHWFCSPNSSTSSYKNGASAEQWFWVPAAQYSAPNAGSSGTISGGGTTKPTISWSLPSGYTNGYGATPFFGWEVERSKDGGAYSVIANLNWDATEYTDTSATTNGKYTYRVRNHNTGRNNAGTNKTTKQYGPYVNCGSVTMTYTVVPTAPASVSVAKAGLGNKNMVVTIKHASNSANATTIWNNIYIERSVDGGNWSQVTSLSGTYTNSGTTTWTDTSTSYNSYYLYRARSHNSVGNSGYVTSDTVWTPAAVAAYDAEGAKKIGIVFAYDDEGAKHDCIILAYDANGSPHRITV